MELSGNTPERDSASGLEDTSAGLRPTDDESKEKKISRKDLLEKTIKRVTEKLDRDRDLSPGLIGNVVQLLKLDWDLVNDGESVKETRVLWEEINGDATDE